MSNDRRSRPVQRVIGSTFMREGEVQESKGFATLGKIFCLYMLWKFADKLVDRFDTLCVLLIFVIAPDLIKKFITMRFGGGVERKERSFSSSSSSISTVDHPPPKE